MEIEIFNGNGINYMARSVGAYLEKKGYRVKRICNADSFDYNETRIIYSENRLPDVLKLIKDIPNAQRFSKNIVESVETSNRIKLIIGKDLIPEFFT